MCIFVGHFPLPNSDPGECTEKINSWRITESFGNWGYVKKSVDFTELYTKHTYRNVDFTELYSKISRIR